MREEAGMIYMCPAVMVHCYHSAFLRYGWPLANSFMAEIVLARWNVISDSFSNGEGQAPGLCLLFLKYVRYQCCALGFEMIYGSQPKTF